MLGRKIGTIAVFAIAFVAGALVFAFAPSRLHAQDNSIQWVPFTVGHVSGHDASAVNIYMTNGSFMVSNSPDDQRITVRNKNGKDRIETPVFGYSSENKAGSAQSWTGALIPGTYFVGTTDDLSTLSISGEALNYTPPAPSTPVAATAPTPVAQPTATPASAGQSEANPSDQTQWFSLTVGHLKNHNTSQVNIDMTNGSFVVSNSPEDPRVTVRDKHGNDRIETPVFGDSSENEEGNAQIWAGALEPGTYYVGVSGDSSTLSIWGDSVNFAPLSSSAQ